MVIETETFENINLGLNHLTIDDIIWREIFLSEPDFRNINNADYKKQYRIEYGKRVFGGKTVIVRSDLNSPPEKKDGKYELTGLDRIAASAETIKELSEDYGAKVIVISHQGTPGKPDCISLEPHKRELKKILKRNIIFKRGHFYGTGTEDTIKNMKNGDIFLLDNIRKLSDEIIEIQDPHEFATLPDSYLETLGKYADYFVNDAFSTSHRWQGSIVGFPNHLHIAGRLTVKEILSNKESIKDIHHPYSVLFGGVKISGYMDYLEYSLENKLVDNILAAGALGIVSVMGYTKINNKKIDLGKNPRDFIKKNVPTKIVNQVAGLIRNYPKSFVMPKDFKVELDGNVDYMTPKQIHEHPDKDRINIYGKGPKTVERFINKITKSKTIYMKGSPTLDDERFLQESKQLVDAIVKRGKKEFVTTILSGGDTNNLVTRFGYNANKDFSYFTLSGGAATEYNSGKLLPGLLMLNTSYNQFWKKNLNEGLPPGYRLGFELKAPKIP